MMADTTYRVLIFEDNPNDVFLINAAFAECGLDCHVTAANSHEQSIQLLTTESFDLFVSDFGSDPLAAQTFLETTRENFPGLPVVVFSGHCDHNLAYKAGVNAVVFKSADLDQFFARIAGIARFWLQVATLPSRPPAEHITADHQAKSATAS